jgi:hypothetical protein
MPDQNYISTELVHFVGRDLTDERRFDLLVEILRSTQLKASYRGEFGVSGTSRTDSRIPLTSNKMVREAAVCFCDIPSGHLGIHMDKYGEFGIAFTKEYLIRLGASPVFYVAHNAAPPPRPGIGPKTLGDRWNGLREGLSVLEMEMRQYAAERNPTWAGGLQFTSTFSPTGTPDELRILGRMSTLFSELDEMVFARIKFFNVGLPDEDFHNYYMEREWRVWGDVNFRLNRVRRIILPASFEGRLRTQLTEYTGEVSPSETCR